MKNSKDYPQTNFWFGFLMGILMGGGTSLILGTKKGREFLKNTLELSENFEERFIHFIKKLEEELEGGKVCLKDSEYRQTTPQDINTSGFNLGSVLQKIKNFSPNTFIRTKN